MAFNDAHPFIDGITRFREEHNLPSDVIKAAIITASYTPIIGETWPTWGLTGTDLSVYEVTPGGNYTAGGNTCANGTVTLNGNYQEIDFDNPAQWEAHASNPTDARWIIFYNSSSTFKECLGWYDLGSVRDMTNGDLIVTLGSPFARVLGS